MRSAACGTTIIRHRIPHDAYHKPKKMKPTKINGMGMLIVVIFVLAGMLVQAPAADADNVAAGKEGNGDNDNSEDADAAAVDSDSQGALNEFLRALLGGLRGRGKEEEDGADEGEEGGEEEGEAGLQAVITIKESFTPQPKIVVTFDEPVSLMTGRIFFVQQKSPDFENFTEKTLPPGGFIDVVGGIPSREARERWRLEPDRALPPGFYVVEIKAKDMVGNEAVFRQFFVVDYETMDIKITRPRLGASRDRNVTVEVSTFKNDAPLNTMCKYSKRDPKFRFFLNGLVSSNMFGPTHIFPTLPREPFIDLTPNRRGNNFFIICQTPQGEVGQAKAEIYVDTEPPTIRSAAFEPNRIVEIPDDHRFFSHLVVEANEDVQCKYALQPGTSFDSMMPFEGYTREEFSAYKSTSRQRMELPEPETRLTKVFFARCEDRSGQLSQEVPAGVTIDLSEPIQIVVSSPKAESNTDAVMLNFTTNKVSRCYYTLSNSSEFLEDEHNPAKTHSADLGTFSDGRYTMQITCESTRAGTLQRSVKEHTFLVDTSPPTAPTFNGSTTSCEPEEFDLDVAVNARDGQSGVRMFRYFVAETEKNGTFGGRDGNGKLPRIEATVPKAASEKEEGERGRIPAFTHTIIISAINNVGLEGPASPLVVGYDSQHPDCLEHDAPEVVLHKKSSPGKVEVTFVCDDESDCDSSTFFYGLGGENMLGAINTTGTAEECTASNHVDGPVEVRRTREVCWEVSDTLGNKADGSEVVAVTTPPTCTNTVKDGDETGVDCGGSCGNTCEEGDSCQIDFDCLGEYCVEGRCIPAKCDDQRTNGDETDLDCGGLSCPRCDLEKKCEHSNDCISGFCDVKATKTCKIPSCTDGSVNGNESDVDCGTACPNKCLPGRACKSADDCASGLCNLGRCGTQPGAAPSEKKAEEKKPAAALAFIKSNMLFIIGILLIGGGLGYLASTSPTPRPPPTVISSAPVIIGPSDSEKKRAETARRGQEAMAVRRRAQVALREKERGGVIGRFAKGAPVVSKSAARPLTLLQPIRAATHLVKTAAQAGTQLAGKIVEKLPEAATEWLPLDVLQKKPEARPRVIPGKTFVQKPFPAQKEKDDKKKAAEDAAFHKMEDDLFGELDKL